MQTDSVFFLHSGISHHIKSYTSCCMCDLFACIFLLCLSIRLRNQLYWLRRTYWYAQRASNWYINTQWILLSHAMPHHFIPRQETSNIPRNYFGWSMRWASYLNVTMNKNIICRLTNSWDQETGLFSSIFRRKFFATQPCLQERIKINTNNKINYLRTRVTVPKNKLYEWLGHHQSFTVLRAQPSEEQPYFRTIDEEIISNSCYSFT